MAKGGHLRDDVDGNAEKPRVNASANGYIGLILGRICWRAAP
jgi:hypothetical protein